MQLQTYNPTPIQIEALSIKVEVTQEDIDQGSRFDPGDCAIALAMRRLGYNATVGLTTLQLMTKNFEPIARFELPLEAQDLVSKFDCPWAWGAPEPVTFTLSLLAS